jgi:hypothetical protein
MTFEVKMAILTCAPPQVHIFLKFFPPRAQKRKATTMDLQRGAEERGCGFRVKKARIYVHLQAERHISSAGIVSFSLHPVAFILPSLLSQHVDSLVYKKAGSFGRKSYCDGATLKPRGVPPTMTISSTRMKTNTTNGDISNQDRTILQETVPPPLTNTLEAWHPSKVSKCRLIQDT